MRDDLARGVHLDIWDAEKLLKRFKINLHIRAPIKSINF